MRIIDISQPLTVDTAVWPGDQPFELDWTMRQDRGDSVNVAAICMSVHAGTHTDGGFHVSADGTRPADLPLDAFIGRAAVVDARGSSTLDESLLERVPADVTRVLFRTRDRVDPRAFPAAFAAPAPELARALVDRGITLVGTDAPSMDDVDSKTLLSHHIFADAGVVTLENLDLSAVEPGAYTLVALPLKLIDADSAPVRAILIEGTLT